MTFKGQSQLSLVDIILLDQKKKTVVYQLYYFKITVLLKIILSLAQTTVLRKFNVHFLKLTADSSMLAKLVIIYYLLYCNSLRL